MWVVVEQSKDSDWRQSIRAQISVLPERYEDRVRALESLRHVLHEEFAQSLRPAFNHRLERVEQDDLSGAQLACTTLNADLRRLGLAIRCGKTGKPAILLAEARSESGDAARFRLQVRNDDGRFVKTLSSNAAPSVELMPDPLREESLARGPRSTGADRGR